MKTHKIIKSYKLSLADIIKNKNVLKRLKSQRKIDVICKRKGISHFKLIQMLCDIAIRYMDDRHNLTPEIKQLLDDFKKLEPLQTQNRTCQNAKTTSMKSLFLLAQK